MLTDRGRELRWFGRTAGAHWPIVELVKKKIHASEKLANLKPSNEVFAEYFQNGIYGMSPESLIVELTWCNPRDIVLLFGAAAQNSGHEPRFGETVLNGVLQQYSQAAWNEKVEELNVEYAAVEIHSVKKVLLDFRRYFKVDQFEKEAKRKAGLDSNIRNLVGKRDTAKVLEDLFRIGVLGQSTKEPRDVGTGLRQLREHWAYRGDNNFDPSAWMILHRALWPELRLGRIEAQIEPILGGPKRGGRPIVRH